MKKWYQSKTLIFNGLTLIAGLLAVFANQSWILEMVAAPYLLGAIGVVNIFLRMVTDKAIA